MNHEDIKTILVTGAAGFIGAALTQRLLQLPGGVRVVGLDSMTPYYDVELKEWRLNRIRDIAENSERSSFFFCRCDIIDRIGLNKIIDQYQPSVIVHLAAQAGVRYCIDHPDEYISSNINGTYHILEACRGMAEAANGFRHLVFASSSSVYGLGPGGFDEDGSGTNGKGADSRNSLLPLAESCLTDKPVSLYAATKKAAEVIAYSYASMYGIPMTGLRFFTVYGPAGRPDMAYYSFTEKLAHGGQIDLYDPERNYRDFTFIDDITEGILRVIGNPPDRASGVPFRIYNIGNQHPVSLPEFVRTLTEEMIGSGLLPADYRAEEHINILPAQTGDVAVTYADCTAFMRDFNYAPQTDLRNGLKNFLAWYKSYNSL